MNGRVDYLVTEEEINLTRGPSGRRGTWRESLLSSLVLRSRVYLAGEQAGPTKALPRTLPGTKSPLTSFVS